MVAEAFRQGDSLEWGRNLGTGCSSQVKKSARRIPSVAAPRPFCSAGEGLGGGGNMGTWSCADLLARQGMSTGQNRRRSVLHRQQLLGFN